MLEIAVVLAVFFGLLSAYLAKVLMERDAIPDDLYSSPNGTGSSAQPKNGYSKAEVGDDVKYGLLVRKDANRRLLDLLQARVPDLLADNLWVESNLLANDKLFCALLQGKSSAAIADQRQLEPGDQ